MNDNDMLTINKVNSYNQRQYSISGDGSIELKSLKATDFWTIQNPEEIVEDLNILFPGWQYYECSGGKFALSPRAATVIKPEGFGQGSVIVTRFKDEKNEQWYLFVADNKTYVQHLQGGVEIGETPVKGIIRETYEEAKIDISDVQLVEIAQYGFMGGNELVNCKWLCRSTVFFASLEWKKVEHLFPEGLDTGKINIVDVSSYSYKLDEITHVIAIPENIDCDSVPEEFPEIKKIKNVSGNKIESSADFSKNGHHRQLWELLFSDKSINKPMFLTEFYFPKRLDSALEEFNRLNKQI